MPERSVRPAVGFAVALLVLQAVGFAAPTIFTWGTHFFVFLPKSFFALYLLVAVPCLWAAVTGRLEQPLRRIGEAVERRPLAVLAIAAVALVAFALLFRVRVPLLGDSFIAVKLYENRLASPAYAPTAHEFLSFSFFFLLMKVTGMTAYPAMADAFLIGEILLGVVFLAAVIATVRLAITDTVQKGAALVLLTTLPSLELYFGYVENYAFVLTALAVYVLAAALYLRGRLNFALLPPLFVLVVLAHYLNAALVLSLIYLGYREVRSRGWTNIALGTGAVALLGAAAWLAAGSSLGLLVPPDRHSPILSASGIANAYQAYTLFSPYHFADLANLALLLAPATLFALGLGLAAGGRSLFAAPLSRFLVLASVPMVVIFLVLQFDLPVAIDWDIPAPYCYLGALLAATAALPGLGTAGPRVAAVLAVTTFLGSLPWWTLNATVEPAIERATLFLDPRISSPDGSYQSAFHLTEWYVHQQDHRKIQEISERFISMYPDDSRGYANYTLYLMEFGPSMDDKIRSIFDRWLARNPSNGGARVQYAHFELDVGQRAYREGRPVAAIGHLERAIALDSSLSDAYNSLGLVFKSLGNIDSAVAWYAKTVALDPLNVSAYINLGNAADDAGKSAEAISWYEKALSVQPNSPGALYNAGLAYANINDTSRAVAVLRRAARLGMTDAQQYLRERGVAW
jgi:tetratricopeptide (TPR) repeat protein